MTKELERIDKSIMAKAGEYQQRLNSQNMTQQQAEAANNDIIERRRSLEAKRQEYDQTFKDVYMRRMQDVRTKIEEYLKEYNKNNTYSYIFSYEPGFIYYRDTLYNITNDVLKGLNEKYKKAAK
jgi:outer membrane protein